MLLFCYFARRCRRGRRSTGNKHKNEVQEARLENYLSGLPRPPRPSLRPRPRPSPRPRPESTIFLRYTNRCPVFTTTAAFFSVARAPTRRCSTARRRCGFLILFLRPPRNAVPRLLWTIFLLVQFFLHFLSDFLTVPIVLLAKFEGLRLII
jgi:hypothetical protein